MKAKSRFPIFTILILCFAASLQSCINSDDYDFDRLSDKVDWTPNMIAPVGYGTYSLWYLLDEHVSNPADSTIILDSQGYLHITYRENNIFTYNASSVLSFPNQVQENFSLPLPGVGIVGPVSIPPQTDIYSIQTGNSGLILSQVEADAMLQFSFTNPLNADISLTVELPNGTIGGAPASKTFTIPANASNYPQNFDLTGLNLAFNTPYSTNNEIDIDFSGTILSNGSTITGLGDLSISYQVQNINFNLAYGDFGKQPINIGNGTIDLNVDFWDDVEGEYQFADPRIYLYMNNSVGIPFEINANLTGYNTDGSNAALNPQPQQPNYPQNITEVNSGIQETVVYNRDNSDIVAVMALPPTDRMDYSGLVNLNPNQVDIATKPNILSSNSSINVDLEVDIPLDFSATNLMLRDTINNIDIQNADKIMNAAIVITAENGYPLNVKIDKVYFADAAYNLLDSVSDNKVIDAANVYQVGEVQEGEVDPSSIVEKSHEITLDQSQIAHLNDTRNIIVNASVSTVNSGTQDVKLKGEYELKFAISVQAQIDFNN